MYGAVDKLQQNLSLFPLYLCIKFLELALEERACHPCFLVVEISCRDGRRIRKATCLFQFSDAKRFSAVITIHVCMKEHSVAPFCVYH